MEHKLARVLRDVGDRTVRFTLSDGSVDRMGDTVSPNGWDLTSYRRNPVVLFAHDSSSPPIGRMRSVWSDGSRLLGDVEFAGKETYEFADTIFKLVKGGFLKSGSVGFLPTDYDFAGKGVSYKRQELLEFSIVPVPANANALVEARMKGILSIRDARRLRRALDDGPLPSGTIGNCGRPADQECGLKDASECATHSEIAPGISEAEIQRLVAKAKRNALNAPVPKPALDTPSQRLAYAEALRVRYNLPKKIDPRIINFDVQHRMRRW